MTIQPPRFALRQGSGEVVLKLRMRGCEMHRKNIVSVVVAVCVGFACVPAAHAGFVNEVPPATPEAGSGVVVASVPGTALSVSPAGSAASANADPKAPGGPSTVTSSRNSGKFSEIGFYPDDVSVARGKGRDISLADMLLAVVPKGFHVDMGNADGTQVVTWSGGLPWDTVLANAVSPLASVGATIDWTQHTVLFRRIDPAMPPVMAAEKSTASAPLSSEQPAPLVWTLRQGYPIGKELMAWGKTVGWNLVWQLPRDVVAPATSTFTGDFPTAATEVVRTLAENGALIHAKIFDGNHTVVVQGPGVSPQ
jgi:hypothetical protein